MAVNPIQVPVVNIGEKYVNGLNLQWDSEKRIIVYPGICRDSSNTNDIQNENAIFVDGLKVGANGVDLKPLEPFKGYFVYIIGDSTEYKVTSALLSLQYGEPNLPFGYDMKRRIGYVITDNLGNINKFYMWGYGLERTVWFDAQLPLKGSPYTIPDYTNIALLTDFTVPTESVSVVPPDAHTGFIQYVPGVTSSIINVVPLQSLSTGAGVIEMKDNTVILKDTPLQPLDELTAAFRAKISTGFVGFLCSGYKFTIS